MEHEELNGNEYRRNGNSRGGYPRFASFFTIAVAILLLFGAVSRFGKVQETFALFGIDTRAETRIRREEERLRTALTLGGQPQPANELRPPAGRVTIDRNAAPPLRDEFNFSQARGNEQLRPSASMARPTLRPDGQETSPGGIDTAPFRRVAASGKDKTYVVANGDNWFKIARRTLGDGKRWKEIQNANPAARDGLRVGMTLTIPD